MKHKRNTSFTHFTTNLILFVNSFNSCLMYLLVLYLYPHICISFGLWVNVILFHWDQMINVSRYEDIWSWIVYRERFVVLVAWSAYPYSPWLLKMSLILLIIGFAIHVSVCFQLIHSNADNKNEILSTSHTGNMNKSWCISFFWYASEIIGCACLLSWRIRIPDCSSWYMTTAGSVIALITPQLPIFIS